VAVDIGRVLRLHGAITSTLAAVPIEQAGLTGEALPASYTRLRGEAIDIIPLKARDEFERLFPEDPKANEARVLLATLAGWLGGFVDEARMKR
jgi:hypothetical protein